MKHVLYFLVGLFFLSLFTLCGSFLLFWRQWIYGEPAEGLFWLWNILQAGLIMIVAGMVIFIIGSIFIFIYDTGKEVTEGIRKQFDER